MAKKQKAKQTKIKEIAPEGKAITPAKPEYGTLSISKILEKIQGAPAHVKDQIVREAGGKEYSKLNDELVEVRDGINMIKLRARERELIKKIGDIQVTPTEESSQILKDIVGAK